MPIAASEYGSFKLMSSIFLVFLFIVSTGISFCFYLEQLHNRNGINKTIHLNINALLGLKKINANHAKEGKITKQCPKKSIKWPFQFLITQSKQYLLEGCFLNEHCSMGMFYSKKTCI